MSGTTQIYNKGPDDAIMQPTSRKLLNTWKRIKGSRPAPSRCEISMRDLLAVLPWTCILQRDPHSASYVYRLAGSAACDLTGRQLTGTTVFDDVSDLDRKTINRSLDTVVATMQPCVAHFLAYSYTGREICFEFTAVPVIAANGKDVQVLATIAPLQDRRGLAADPLVQFHVRKVRILWDDQPAGRPVSAPISGSDGVRHIKSGFLRVIEGGKA